MRGLAAIAETMRHDSLLARNIVDGKTAAFDPVLKVRQPDGSYFGELYQIAGPAFNAQPWTAVGVTQVGTMRLRFSNGETGTLEYTAYGVTVTKTIKRQVSCSGGAARMARSNTPRCCTASTVSASSRT